MLEQLGRVYQSDFENILLLKVASIPKFLDDCDRKFRENSEAIALFERIVSVTQIFGFQSASELETKAKRMSWVSYQY
ncbi:MAG: hypothetical protein AAFY63_14560 [Cyanobacteria bacterium J06643_13]